MSGRLWHGLVFVAAVFAFGGTHAPAFTAPQEAVDEGNLPKAETVLDGYVEATGGKKAYRKLRSRVAKGKLSIPAMKTEGVIRTYQMAPNKLYTVVEMEGLGKIEKGTDGTVAWELAELTGARILEGSEKAFMMREATFNADLDWRKILKSYKTVGIEMIEDQPAYKLEVVTSDDAQMTLYYDKYTNLLLRLDTKITTMLGEIAVEVYPSDYKKVNGIMVPHKSTQKMMGITQVSTFESVSFNSKIKRDRFALPTAVKRLLQERKKR